jgi:CBS domain-containing protein
MTPTRTVGSLMSRYPVVIAADAPIVDAARLLDNHHLHGLPVVDEAGALVGVVSQSDMLRARTTADMWARWPGLRVRHLMTSPAMTITADVDVIDAAQTMEREHIHRLVVVDVDGLTPIGIISTTDLVHGIVEEAPA